MTIETMIESLTLQEKMAAMELIWRDLSAEPSSFPSPEWHGVVVADRLAKPAFAQNLTIEDARQTVREALDASRTLT